MELNRLLSLHPPQSHHLLCPTGMVQASDKLWNRPKLSPRWCGSPLPCLRVLPAACRSQPPRDQSSWPGPHNATHSSLSVDTISGFGCLPGALAVCTASGSVPATLGTGVWSTPSAMDHNAAISRACALLACCAHSRVAMPYTFLSENCSSTSNVTGPCAVRFLSTRQLLGFSA
jgi:hypothetical protein